MLAQALVDFVDLELALACRFELVWMDTLLVIFLLVRRVLEALLVVALEGTNLKIQVKH